jgi:hypothetical protein
LIIHGLPTKKVQYFHILSKENLAGLCVLSIQAG